MVLLLRAFVFEPFRIPSDSMMPTLLDGDFIIVNKYAYGLRLPVLNRKILAVGEPQRGDVVVFRYPAGPLAPTSSSAWWGCPGITSRCATTASSSMASRCRSRYDAKYNDGCYVNLTQIDEHLGKHEHKAIFCPVAHRPAAGAAGLQPRRRCAATSAGTRMRPGIMRTPPFVGDGAAGAISDDGRQP